MSGDGTQLRLQEHCGLGTLPDLSKSIGHYPLRPGPEAQAEIHGAGESSIYCPVESGNHLPHCPYTNPARLALVRSWRLSAAPSLRRMT